mgnify:FL=1
MVRNLPAGRWPLRLPSCALYRIPAVSPLQPHIAMLVNASTARAGAALPPGALNRKIDGGSSGAVPAKRDVTIAISLAIARKADEP